MSKKVNIKLRAHRSPTDDMTLRVLMNPVTAGMKTAYRQSAGKTRELRIKT